MAEEKAPQAVAEARTRAPEIDPTGIGTVEACRQMVIDHKTGYRRRTKPGRRPSDRGDTGARSSQQLSLRDRAPARITTQPEHGHGVSEDDASAGPSTLNDFAGTDEN